MKKMHRMIMLSSAYQQSSSHQPEAAKVDPDNKLLWRFDRRRLEGEVIRDSMLLAAGQLNLKPGGPGVFPPLPPGVSMPGSKYMYWQTEKDPAEASRRKRIRFRQAQICVNPMFETFDSPTRMRAARAGTATVTPTQPLR